ncbi:hypothetical protein EYZ11_004489 [Aspergillus tanneri]|uniref:Uncharacterized protein n=1 Tax=Aspergillus tanneri TaxID=1220188 RepID=A0A4S3JKB2_9EURO|nr:hypothetical protein EYZ11_004489 [Aspergillus tanneri]
MQALSPLMDQITIKKRVTGPDADEQPNPSADAVHNTASSGMWLKKRVHRGQRVIQAQPYLQRDNLMHA